MQNTVISHLDREIWYTALYRAALPSGLSQFWMRFLIGLIQITWSLPCPGAVSQFVPCRAAHLISTRENTDFCTKESSHIRLNNTISKYRNIQVAHDHIVHSWLHIYYNLICTLPEHTQACFHKTNCINVHRVQDLENSAQKSMSLTMYTFKSSNAQGWMS